MRRRPLRTFASMAQRANVLHLRKSPQTAEMSSRVDLRPAAVSRGVSRIAIAAAVAATFLGISVSGALAAGAQPCGASAYSLALRALNGPTGTDLDVRIRTAKPTCELPASLERIRPTIF